MKKFLTLLLIVTFTISTINLFAQAQTNMYFSGDMNSWGGTAMSYRSLGTPNWIVTIQSSTNRSSSGFKFRNSSTDWDNLWGRGDAVSKNTNTTWYSGGGNGTFNEISGKYYSFTWKDVTNGTNSYGYVMETSAAPVTISSVTQSPAADDVSDNDAVTVTVTTSAAPCAEEHIYVRYSSDNWSSSSFAEVSFSGSATGTATIPALSAGTSVSYYVFSTTVANPTADYDLLTLNYNNNSGPNYSYTTKYGTTADGAWSSTSTWKSSTVPTSTQNVIINHVVTVSANSPTNPATANNLTINNGGSVTVNSGQALTVSGNLTNNGLLTITSDANGNGSLIVNGTVTGSATVQRYIAGYTSNAGSGNGWHLISSPVDNMAISGSDFVPGTSSPNLDDFYAWDEATNTWKNYKVSANNITNFTNGEGYLVAYQSTATKNFTGTPNNSNITFSNLSYNTTEGDGWHLLGNPYPSALTWGDANWALSGVDGTAKVWDESAGNYIDVASGGIIPSTNGFFVQVTSGTNSLTIPASDRVHDATNNFKKASSTNKKETLTFKVTNDANGYYDVATLGFKNDATEGFDHAFDSHKLFSMVKTAPSLWTVSKSEQLSTNYLPETTKAYNLPLDFKPGVSTVYHLSVSGVSSFANPHFVLEDTQTGTMIDLSQQTNYDFSATKGDDVNRFVLHINGVTAVPNLSQKETVQVFAYGKTIYLSGNESLNGKVSVFNTLGQQVYEGTLNGMYKQTLRLNQQSGIYFVRVASAHGVATKKVFIK